MKSLKIAAVAVLAISLGAPGARAQSAVDKIYADLQEELRNQYSLGYTPAKSDQGVGYRKIALATKQKDLKVQARNGYYADR